jgi:hypothetical protein
VNAFLERPLEGEWPYLWLDATYLKVREGGRIVSVAAIIAVAVDTDGRREIIGLGLGPSEAETFWSTFLKGLVRRGLKGVKLVISDAHEGLKHAVAKALSATWQRCRVHWLRCALAHVPKGQHTMVAAALRQAFLQADLGLCCNVPGWLRWSRRSAPSGSSTEQSRDEGALGGHVVGGDGRDLTLADHRHDLVAGEGTSSRRKAREAQARTNQTLHSPMVLLNDVVQVLGLA